MSLTSSGSIRSFLAAWVIAAIAGSWPTDASQPPIINDSGDGSVQVAVLPSDGPGPHPARSIQESDGPGSTPITAGGSMVAPPDSDVTPQRVGTASHDGPSLPRLGQPIVEVSDGFITELHVDDWDLATFLEMLSLESRRNIITSPAVQGRVRAHLYSVTFEQALEAVLASNNAGYRVEDNFIYVYTLEELSQLEDTENPPQSRVFSLNYITASDVQPAITPLLSTIGVVSVSAPAETGIATNSEAAGGNLLATQDFVVVYDYEDRLEAIARIIAELDIRPKQVLIEATILRVQLTEDNALGIDFALTGGVDLAGLGATSNGISDLILGALPPERFESFSSVARTNLTSSFSSGGMTLGVIKDHVAVFVRALESVADTTVIANPKILALNKQRGEVIVGREDGYPVITVTETASVQTTALVKTGTRLLFRPFISDDGWIRMELHPEDSVGGVAGDQPFKETTEVTTNVMIRDGQTILIGGLFRDATSSKHEQLPFLGELPVIGNLFRSTQDAIAREEVIILLTVHIVKDFDAYAQYGSDQLHNIERIRIGARRGTQWHGRERLAQSHYRRALEHYADDEMDKALWEVRMTLHSNSRFLPALVLKEQILGRSEWEDDGSATRDFIHELIARDRMDGRTSTLLTNPLSDSTAATLQGAQGFTDLGK